MSVNLTQSEIKLVSCVISDLVTGNNLLDRPGTCKYLEMFSEIILIINMINTEQSLDSRQKSIVIEMGRNFYNGIDDMAEQLRLDLIKVRNSISC